MLGKNVNFMKHKMTLKYYRKLKRSCSARIVFLMNTFFQIHHCIFYPQHKLIITAHENIKSENEGVKVLG